MKDIPAAATKALVEYLEEGLALFPGATPSHLCLRTKTPEEYAAFQTASRLIGKVTERDHKGRSITWVKLDNALMMRGSTLQWLEIISPDPDRGYDMGFQALVMTGKTEIPVKHPSLANPDFILRLQGRSAAEIVSQPA